MKIAVIGCSNGAEVYSINWALRSGRRDVRLTVYAFDISAEILQIAREGFYPFHTQQFIGSPIFERLTDEETAAMFCRGEDGLLVQQWIREGIEWQIADAMDPNLCTRTGLLDVVVANNFLCHMNPADSERCLRNLAKLVRAGGYIVVSGIDLDIRTKVAVDLGWKPISELLEEIHDGDPSVRRDWPWRYWGVEPLDRTRPDWEVRYASVFRTEQV
jgi:chemotaxis methyl-accepting protein methylase